MITSLQTIIIEDPKYGGKYSFLPPEFDDMLSSDAKLYYETKQGDKYLLTSINGSVYLKNSAEVINECIEVTQKFVDELHNHKKKTKKISKNDLN
jgi:hypothetical protein